MNKPVNFMKAGIISILHSPGGDDELIVVIVTERLYKMCKSAQERVLPFDPMIVSDMILSIIWDGDELVKEVLEYDVIMSYGEYPVEYLNKYEIVGMIPIQTY